MSFDKLTTYKEFVSNSGHLLQTMYTPLQEAVRPLADKQGVLKMHARLIFFLASSLPLFLAAGAVAQTSSAGSGQTSALVVGSPAPPIHVAKWIKGNPVNLHDGGVHVVEFWATWCGPCKVSIPHLTELAKKYKGKADFTGVSVFEVRQATDDSYIPKVEDFVQQMGPQMDYNVAADGHRGFMANSWMVAAHQDGIPTAFVVGRDGNIQWIGHPMMGLDEVVGKVLTGNFNAKQAAEEGARAREAAEAQQKKMAELMAPLQEAAKSRDPKQMRAALDNLFRAHPEMEANLGMMKFSLLTATDEPAAYVYARRLADGPFKNDAQGLNNLAWTIVADDSKLKHPDYKLAIEIAERAVAMTKSGDANILDTLAYAYFKDGQPKKAIPFEQKAVALAKADSKADPATVKELEGHLAAMQAKQPRA